MNQVTLINGNGNKYTLDLPKLCILNYINETALKKIENTTGLKFKFYSHLGENGIYEAQPERHEQITQFIMCYNWKYKYYNNASNKNIIYFKHFIEEDF